MTLKVTGRIVDETGAGRSNLTVVAEGDWLLTTEQLARTETDRDGRFTLEVPPILDISDTPRSFRLRVRDFTGRAVTKDRELAGDVQGHSLGDVTVQSADLDGLLVTHLTGTATLVSEGNAVELLVDGGEAFGRVADDIRGAAHSINMTQLFFALPPEFRRAAREEKPALVFKFLPPPLAPIDPLDPNPPAHVPRESDDRPERLLIDEAETDRTIRILLNEPALGFPEGVFWLGVLTPLAAGLGVGGVSALAAWVGIGIPFFPLVLGLTVLAFFAEAIFIRKKLEDTTDVDEAHRYFGDAFPNAPSSPRFAIRGFRQPAPDNGVLHCKMVITDENRAVVIGSPFSQRYFDSLNHRIEDPHRGANTSDMVHDLSLAVVGPAVRDLHDTFRLYWNEDLPQLEQLPAAPAPAPQPPANNVCKAQVVRTLSGTRFKGLGGTSEKGILESYLRAFAAAENYIYLETQYFTDAVITAALCAVLKKNPRLELILVVPIKPDVLFYPRRSAWRIRQLRDAGGDRVGVFTRWSYDEKHSRPWVAPVYIHSKGGIVDDSWAAVGSANLDGLSLDYNLLLSPLVFGEAMAAELNVNVIPPAPGTATHFAELMRRRLFAEHLGLVGPDGSPDPNHGSLGADRPARWLSLWNSSAEKALEHLKSGSREPLPGFVLQYPKEDGGRLDTPRRHLAALGVNLKRGEEAVRPVTGTRAFDFSTGKWSKFPEREDLR